jgi:peptidoglycan/LPS O-acetylase OafA/YrhL
MLTSNSKESAYIPTLDGWRALSIGLVLLSHSRVSCTVPVLGAFLQSLSNFGGIGVEIFFGISGLLICSRLLEEESRCGQISMKDFYVRRFFRILPAALFYLLLVAILATFQVIPVPAMDWFGSLFFFRNYLMLFEYVHKSPLAIHWYTGHFWSLSMEEHFYLVLPAILVSFKRKRLRVLGGLALVVALWRSISAHFFHSNDQFTFRTDTHVDALLVPAMIAVALYPFMRNQAAKRYIPAWSFPVFIGMAAFLLTVRVPFSFTLRAVVIPLLILSTALHPHAVPGRILEFKPVRWIGWISYSLYLWQQLFFGARFVGSPPGIAVLRQWPINLVALMVCATFSYYLLEKPFVRLGHKFASFPPARSTFTKGVLNPVSLPINQSALDRQDAPANAYGGNGLLLERGLDCRRDLG